MNKEEYIDWDEKFFAESTDEIYEDDDWPDIESYDDYSVDSLSLNIQ